MYYIDDGVLGVVFQVVSGNYARTEEVPNFKEDTQGMDKLRSVLSGVQSDHFYPTVLDKAAYIFIQINKGHYFSNGNKRLALVSSVVFLIVNGYFFRSKLPDCTHKDPKIIFDKILDANFPYEDYKDFIPEESILYNLSILVADNHKYCPDFPELKNKVTAILREITICTW